MKSHEGNKPTAFETLKRLISLGKPYWGRYFILCIIVAVLSLTSVALAESLRRIVNATVDGNMAGLISGGIFAIGVVVVDGAGNFAKTYVSGVLEYKSVAKLQASVLSKLMKVRMENLEQHHSADLISRINDSAPAAQMGINEKTIDMIENILKIVFMLTYLVSLQYMLTLGTILICATIPLIMVPFTRKLRAMHEERQKVATEQQTFIQDAIQGAEVVRSFSLAGKLKEQFMKRAQEHLRIHFRVTRVEAVGYNLPFAVILGGLLYVLSFGGYLVIKGTLDVGAVAAFLISFEQISQPVARLSNLWTELQSSMAQGNRLFSILDLEEEGSSIPSQDQNYTHVNQDKFPSIKFEQVGFRYGEGADVLKGLSLEIKSGKVTAIAGPSGSGKSTILNLLMAAYEPNEGSIYCGDISLRDIRPKDWRNEIAYVSQDPYLFTGTLFENIAWGRLGATREDVMNAARAAGIHDFIMSTLQQYETIIGERGLTLSGGERQRMSIARAFVREPRLLLLDEPTAALDSHNEELVQQALKELMHDRTTVVVAHRLSTIRDADLIYYLENGEVVESGTHNELMILEGNYMDMVSKSLDKGTLQSQREEVGA
ncbi:ABC transporter ATP-binding protein [Paenibacillus segetis]|uniref:ABC transporter ATP-binding protein n=1 Tax=Paenibacillus segetis TaxID=1325360 RepID=A0ABQ1YKJ6_9BACL|nr:ABC transporter ATP-binding protein [Paenibacillus segetis]GGH28351.1 ABC transporter ATP-binding protein [Paenibacillus segetis]